MFLAKFFLGMFLAYYCISPRLRHFVNGKIQLGLGYLFPSLRRKKIRVRNHSKTAITVKSSPIKVGEDKGKVVVDETEIEQWLKNNPDLRRVNRVLNETD